MAICDFCSEECETIFVQNTGTDAVICMDCVFRFAEGLVEIIEPDSLDEPDCQNCDNNECPERRVSKYNA